MKNTMPRLIDDQRRKRNLKICVGAILAIVAVLFAYDAWMAQFRGMVKELAALASEGRDVLNRLEKTAGTEDETRLEAAAGKMDKLARATQPASRPVVPLEIDPVLFVEADRKKAERIRNEHANAVSDRNRAEVDLERARKAAADVFRRLQSLRTDGVPAAAQLASVDLRQGLEELSKLTENGRPDKEEAAVAKRRFEEALKRAAEAHASSGKRVETVSALLAEAEKIDAAAKDASKRAKEAVAGAARLREEADNALEIDKNGQRLKILRETLAAEAEAVRKAEESLTADLKTAGAEYAKITKTAREACGKAVAKIETLDARDGALLPRQTVAEGLNAKAALEKEIGAAQADWTSFSADATSLTGRAKRLCGEAGRLVETLGNGTTTAAADGTRATELSTELRDILEKLSSIDPAARATGFKTKTDAVVAHAEVALAALEAAKPDIRKYLDEIQTNARVALSELKRTNDEKKRLQTQLEEGDGAAKRKLLESLSKCTVLPEVEAELQRLGSETATDGNGIGTMQIRIKKASEAVQKHTDSVKRVATELASAEQSGTFTRVSWVEGALERAGGTGNAFWTVNSGSALVPRTSVSSRQREWEFALDIPETGEHEIEVRIEKTTSEPVNDSIDPKVYSLQEGSRIRGGWIGVKTTLAAASREWSNVLWIPNRKTVKSQTVVNAKPSLSKGFQSFVLKMDLDSNPDSAQYSGWHAETLTLQIYLDGKPVRKFWHKKQ